MMKNLKDTEALKKTLDHFDIIYKDIISIFNKKQNYTYRKYK